MIRKVLELGDPELRRSAAVVDDPSSPAILELVRDLEDTLRHWRRTTTYGRGIAATQIGVPHRVVLLNLDRPRPLINPVIVARSPEKLVLWDACLSFLTFFFHVERNAWIDVTYQAPDGTEHQMRAEGGLSELLQHEVDHLDGIVAVDRMTDVATMCTRSEFEARHRHESPYATC